MRMRSRASPGISATATPRCRWSATACASAAIMCWKRCWRILAPSFAPSRRRSSPSAARTIIMRMPPIITATNMANEPSSTRATHSGHLSPLGRGRPEGPSEGALAKGERTVPPHPCGEREPAGASGPALYRLMAWLSPSYPVGAFSYSGGLEWAVEAGDVSEADTLRRWLAVMIQRGGGFCDAVFLTHAHRSATVGNDADLQTVAELAAAFAPSKERHMETTAQGSA